MTFEIIGSVRDENLVLEFMLWWEEIEAIGRDVLLAGVTLEYLFNGFIYLAKVFPGSLLNGEAVMVLHFLHGFHWPSSPYCAYNKLSMYSFITNPVSRRNSSGHPYIHVT